MSAAGKKKTTKNKHQHNTITRHKQHKKETISPKLSISPSLLRGKTLDIHNTSLEYTKLAALIPGCNVSVFNGMSTLDVINTCKNILVDFLGNDYAYTTDGESFFVIRTDEPVAYAPFYLNGYLTLNKKDKKLIDEVITWLVSIQGLTGPTVIELLEMGMLDEISCSKGKTTEEKVIKGLTAQYGEEFTNDEEADKMEKIMYYTNLINDMDIMNKILKREYQPKPKLKDLQTTIIIESIYEAFLEAKEYYTKHQKEIHPVFTVALELWEMNEDGLTIGLMNHIGFSMRGAIEECMTNADYQYSYNLTIGMCQYDHVSLYGFQEIRFNPTKQREFINKIIAMNKLTSSWT